MHVPGAGFLARKKYPGVIIRVSIPSSVNKQTQIAFRETLQPDILVVHQMLTTGYDVNRLKKMYLLRNAKEHTLLQTIPIHEYDW